MDNTNEQNNTPEVDVNEIMSSNESLKNKNAELLDELKQVKNTIKELGGLDTIKSTFEQVNSIKEKKLQEENSVEQLRAHYDEQIQKAQAKNQELVNGIIDSTIDQQLRSAVTKAKGSYELLEPILKRHVQGEYQDGKVNIVVKDANGMPMMVDGKEAGIANLVDSFRNTDQYARAFDASSEITGSGTPPGSPKFKMNKEPKTLDDLTEMYRANPQAALETMRSKGIM